MKKIWSDQDDRYATRSAERGTWQVVFDLQHRLKGEGDDAWKNVPTVSDPNKKVRLTLSGNANEGEKTFDNLPKYDAKGGEYEYRAIEARLSGYEDPLAEHKGTAGSYSSTLTNTLKTTKVTGTKAWVDDGPQHRPDTIELVLYRQVGTGTPEEVTAAPQPAWSNTTAETWTYTYEGLPANDKNDKAYTYTVKERSVPDGYWASYSADGLHITNTQTAFGLDKRDAETKEPVNDVELTVLDSSGTTPLVTWTRSAGGAVSVVSQPGAPIVSMDKSGKILGLPVGDYVLRETKVPAAYVKADDISFSLKADGTLSSALPGVVSGDALSGFVLTMEDRLARASVELTKSVEGGKGSVAGVEFALYKEDGTLVKENLVTRSDGKLRVDNLEVGKYYFKETKATPDTVLNAEKCPFEVTNDKNGQTIPVNIKNKPFAASLELVKLDGTSGEAIDGAAFTLTYTLEGGGEPQTLEVPAVPESMGKYLVNSLKKGKYTLEETTVPNGYTDAYKASFVLDDTSNGTVVTMKKDTPGITNTRILGSVELTKQTEGDDRRGVHGG